MFGRSLLSICSLFVVSFLLSSCAPAANDAIARDVLKRKMRDGALVIDVREPDEYRSGHIKGAINIPHEQVEKEIERHTTDKSKSIAVYCGRGGRAAYAEERLTKMGYRNVSNLGGYSYLAEPGLVE